MAAAALRSEERIGLIVALAAHAGLAALLLWHPRSAPVVMPPDRIEVTISDDVGLTSTSPEPQAHAAPDVAPEIGEAPPPPAPVAEPLPPRPAPRAEPPPRPEPPKPQVRAEPPRVQPRPVPRAVASPPPRPVPKPTMRPAPPKPVARPTAQPSRQAPPLPGTRPAARPAQAAPARPAPAKPVTRPGGSRVGADFLSGVSGAQAPGQSRNPPAQATGPQKAALNAAISRALKPYWAVPQGPDTELLVTRVRFRLARDGSLIGDPEVLSTTGITDANKAQVPRHREQAIRAVRLAHFDNLPDDLYSAWQVVTSTFDRRLSQ